MVTYSRSLSEARSPRPPGVRAVNAAADSSTQPQTAPLSHSGVSAILPSHSRFLPNIIEKSICRRISVQSTNTIISNHKGDEPTVAQLCP